jgi:hypothetical protein
MNGRGGRGIAKKLHGGDIARDAAKTNIYGQNISVRCQLQDILFIANSPFAELYNKSSVVRIKYLLSTYFTMSPLAITPSFA